MRSVIVSDTTALIILSKLHRFDLLSNLFERVVLPRVVYEELTVKESVELPDFSKSISSLLLYHSIYWYSMRERRQRLP